MKTKRHKFEQLKEKEQIQSKISGDGLSECGINYVFSHEIFTTSVERSLSKIKFKVVL